MKIRLLGPLEVLRDDATSFEPAAAKVRQVLAVLALDPGRVRSVESIVDALWGEAAPASAVNLVQGYVSDLRRLLGAASVTRSGSGYRLDVAADTVDLARFESLLVQARTLLLDDPELASSILQEAMQLWTGEPFAGIVCQGILAAAQVRAAAMFVAATEMQMQADLACGRHQAVLPRLQELTRSHRLHEAFWVQLGLALYRSGRQAEALRSFHELRTLLADEVGVSPGPEALAMERRISAHDPSLVGGVVVQEASGATGYAAVESAGQPLPSVVGRRYEKELVSERLSRTVGGGQHLVLIAGEPGIGKTTLALEACREAAARGAVVLSGRCDEDVVAPYMPFVSALSDYLNELPSEVLHSLLGPNLHEACEVVPSLHIAREDRRTGEESNRAGLSLAERFETFCWLLNVVRADRPLVLLVEDLHWADSTTIALLRHLVLGRRIGATLVLGTYRPTEVAPESRFADLLVQLRSDTNSERLVLHGLAVNEIAALAGDWPSHASAEAPHGWPADVGAVELAFADWIHRETAGNPLFVRELIRHVRTTGRRSGVPEGVTEVLGQRVRRLSRGAQLLLERAAVLGDVFPVSLLRAMNGDLPDLADAASEAVHAGILEEEPGQSTGYRFTHSTVRQAVAGLSTAVKREDLHLRAARALSSLDRSGNAAISVAAHFVAAGSAAPAGEAVAAFAWAGDYSNRSWAKAEAVQWYDRALELLDEADPRHRTLRLTRFVAAQGAWHWHFDRSSIAGVQPS